MTVFSGGRGVAGFVDSGPKPLCHRYPTGPHLSGLAWTPVDSCQGLFDQERLRASAPQPQDTRARHRIGLSVGGLLVLPDRLVAEAPVGRHLDRLRIEAGEARRLPAHDVALVRTGDRARRV